MLGNHQHNSHELFSLSEKWKRSFVSRLVPHPPCVHCSSVVVSFMAPLCNRARFQERLSLKKCQIKVKALFRKYVCEGRRQRLDVLRITSFFSMLVFLSHTASILPDYSLRSFLTSKVGGQTLCPASVHISGVKSFLITYKKFKLAAFLHR